MSNEAHMQRAAALALEKMKAGSGGPFGAIIVRGDEVISEGWNQVTSTNDPTAHAEVVAIRVACRKLNTFQLTDCDMYASCEPCPMCLGSIYWARLRNLYYANTRQEAAQIGFDDEFIYSQIGLSPASRTIPGIRLITKDSHIPFAEWVKKPDKIAY